MSEIPVETCPAVAPQEFLATPSIATATPASKSRWLAVLVTVAFAVFFLLLRSRQYNAVDGALRCLSVFGDRKWQLHGNNHLLYPLWMWLWTRAAALIGFSSTEWVGFIGQCQALNAICAASAIGMLFVVLQEIAGTRYALLGSLQFGFSTAVVLHATNSAEPVIGLFFALTALAALVLVLRLESKVGFFLIGVLLTLALASYQLMALVAPMVAFACICWPEVRWRRAVLRLVLVSAGGLLSLVPLYYAAYSSLGISPDRMAARFFVNDAGDFYAGFELNKLVNPPMGMLRSLFWGLPENYGGIRALIRNSHGTFWIPAITVSLLLLAGLGWLVATCVAGGIHRSSGPKPIFWSGTVLSVLAVAFPLYYGGPLYDKFWLIPLATISIAAAFAFRFSPVHSTRRRLLTAGVLGLLVVEAVVNIPRTFRDHVRETAHLNEAVDLASMIKPKDSVVLDFDDVSMLWFAIWGYGKSALVLPASSRDQAKQWFASAEQIGLSGNGSLLFVSVLDHDRAGWEDFLGGATGLHYPEFDCYRENSVILRRYPYAKRSITVRQIRFPNACGAFR